MQINRSLSLSLYLHSDGHLGKQISTMCQLFSLGAPPQLWSFSCSIPKKFSRAHLDLSEVPISFSNFCLSFSLSLHILSFKKNTPRNPPTINNFSNLPNHPQPISNHPPSTSSLSPPQPQPPTFSLT